MSALPLRLITDSKFRINSYPLVASSQHVDQAAAVSMLQVAFVMRVVFCCELSFIASCRIKFSSIVLVKKNSR